jgi:N-dimethylarginine dimethylaminohydrolase
MTQSVLMCRPDHFGIEYEINPWMHVAVEVDHALAAAQWQALYQAYVDLGVSIELATPVNHLPDMVFTANAAVLWDDRAVLSNFHHAERQGEETHWRQELERLGFDVHELPRSLSFEGAGDALFLGDRLFCGYGFRTDRASHRPVARILEVEVVSLELVDPRFYHLDTAMCPLTDDTLMYYAPAFDAESRGALQRHFRYLIEASEADAAGFGLNAVSDGQRVVLSAAAVGLIERLTEHGLEPIGVSMTEFRKSGGAVKCCTLELR